MGLFLRLERGDADIGRVRIIFPPRRRLRSCRGSLMLEGALALLPMIAMLFGLLDIALAIYVRNTMEFAVRQGVRYAVTSQTVAGLAHDASIKSVVNKYSMGMLSKVSAGGTSQISITYYNPVTIAVVAGAGSNVGGN